MKRLFPIIMCCLFLKSYAQDPHFSQFFASPLTLNPAYTGKIDGDFRIAGNYRDQWPTFGDAFKTTTVSFDAPILVNRLPEYDTWGVGIMGLNDQSGNKILNNNFISVSTAYSKGLDENGYHQLSVGFQGTYANKRLDVTKATFEDQLTALGFTGVTQEVFSSQNVVVNYFDVNTGIMYNGSTNGYNSFYLGVSLYHINRPKESFRGGNYILSSRTTIHGGGYTPINTQLMFHGSFIHQSQAGASETVVGGAVAYSVTDEEATNPTSVYLGSWYRFSDAFIPYVGLEFSGFRLGFSYDLNTSSLRTASNGRGGKELSLVYVHRPSDPSRKRLNCPKF